MWHAWHAHVLFLYIVSHAEIASACDLATCDETSLMQLHVGTLRQKSIRGELSIIKNAKEITRLDTVMNEAHCIGKVWDAGTKIPQNLHLNHLWQMIDSGLNHLWQIGGDQPGAGSYVKRTNQTNEWDGLKRMHAAQIRIPASVLIQDGEDNYFLVMANPGKGLTAGKNKLNLDSIFSGVPEDGQWMLAQQLASLHMIDIAIGNDDRLPRNTSLHAHNGSGCQNVFKQEDENKSFIVGMNTASKLNSVDTADEALADADKEFQAMLDGEDGLKYARWMISNITNSKQQDPGGVENQEWLAWAFWSGMVVLKENIDWEDDYDDWFILPAKPCHEIRTACLAYVRKPTKASAVAVNSVVQESCNKWEGKKDELLECQLGATRIVRQLVDVEKWQSQL